MIIVINLLIVVANITNIIILNQNRWANVFFNMFSVPQKEVDKILDIIRKLFTHLCFKKTSQAA